MEPHFGLEPQFKDEPHANDQPHFKYEPSAPYSTGKKRKGHIQKLSLQAIAMFGEKFVAPLFEAVKAPFKNKDKPKPRRRPLPVPADQALPPYDQQVDREVGCDDGADAFGLFVSSLPRGFLSQAENAYGEPHLLGLPLRARFRIYDFITESERTKRKKVVLSPVSSVGGYWQDDHFIEPADVFRIIGSLSRTCFQLRREILSYYCSQFHFHVTFNCFCNPGTAPIIMKWLSKYAKRIQYLTVEIDLTRLGGSFKNKAVGLGDTHQKLTELFELLILKLTDRDGSVQSLHVMCRRYEGYRVPPEENLPGSSDYVEYCSSAKTHVLRILPFYFGSGGTPLPHLRLSGFPKRYTDKIITMVSATLACRKPFIMTPEVPPWPRDYPLVILSKGMHTVDKEFMGTIVKYVVYDSDSNSKKRDKKKKAKAKKGKDKFKAEQSEFKNFKSRKAKPFLGRARALKSAMCGDRCEWVKDKVFNNKFTKKVSHFTKLTMAVARFGKTAANFVGLTKLNRLTPKLLSAFSRKRKALKQTETPLSVIYEGSTAGSDKTIRQAHAQFLNEFGLGVGIPTPRKRYRLLGEAEVANDIEEKLEELDFIIPPSDEIQELEAMSSALDGLFADNPRRAMPAKNRDSRKMELKQLDAMSSTFDILFAGSQTTLGGRGDGTKRKVKSKSSTFSLFKGRQSRTSLTESTFDEPDELRKLNSKSSTIGTSFREKLSRSSSGNTDEDPDETRKLKSKPSTFNLFGKRSREVSVTETLAEVPEETTNEDPDVTPEAKSRPFNLRGIFGRKKKEKSATEKKGGSARDLQTIDAMSSALDELFWG